MLMLMQGAILVCNHTSGIDSIAAIGSTPASVKFIMKQVSRARWLACSLDSCRLQHSNEWLTARSWWFVV